MSLSTPVFPPGMKPMCRQLSVSVESSSPSFSQLCSWRGRGGEPKIPSGSVPGYGRSGSMPRLLNEPDCNLGSQLGILSANVRDCAIILLSLEVLRDICIVTVQY